MAAWQRFNEYLDLSWPPPLKLKYGMSFDVDKMAEAFSAIELDIKRWENILMDLWKPHVFKDNDRYLLLTWVITRLQYLRALYPVMDANKYDYDIKAYFNYAVHVMNTKGPDCTAVVDFMRRKEENEQGDYSAYFDKWFENNTPFGQWHKDHIAGAQNPATKHSIEPSEDTLVHKKAKTEATSTVLPSPPIPTVPQGAGSTPAAKRHPGTAHTSLPHPLPKNTRVDNTSSPTVLVLPDPPLNPRQAIVIVPSGVSTSQSRPAAISWTNGTPDTPSFMPLSPLPTTTIITTSTRGNALPVSSAPVTQPPVAATEPFIQPPPVPQVACPQPVASPPQPTSKLSSRHSTPLSPAGVPPQTPRKAVSHHATSHPPTAAHPIPPPKLTHQLPPKPQISALHATSVQSSTAQAIPPKVAHQQLPASQPTPNACQVDATSPAADTSATTYAHITPKHTFASHASSTNSNSTNRTNLSQAEIAAERKRADEVVAHLDKKDKEDKDIAAAPTLSPTPTPAINQSSSALAFREVEKDRRGYYPSPPGTSGSPQQQQQQPSPPKNVDISPVLLVSQQNPSAAATLQKQPPQPPSGEPDLTELGKVGADKYGRVSPDSHDWLEDTDMDLEPDIAHPSQQQQPITSLEGVSVKKGAEKIIGAPTDHNASQNPSLMFMASQSDVVIGLGPQDSHLQKDPKPVVTTTATMTTAEITSTVPAEVSIPSLLQDIKSWMETESKRHQDQSAFLQRLLVQNTHLETKLEEYTTRMDNEFKKQEACLSKATIPTTAVTATATNTQSTHSWDQELASLKERTLTQELKISQLEAQIESRIRHSLEHDLAMVRNELQEERVDNLTKDLEIKRAEAVDAMAKARAEMWDARQMVAEAREERANAMERAARAEADNQMLLRVINELQGTGWRMSSGQGQAQAQDQVQDAGIHRNMGFPSSVHPRSRIDYLQHQFTSSHVGAAGSSSTFMRFGTSMQQSFSSSSTESLPERTAAAVAGGVDPSIHRMEFMNF
ncbi:hypothetical protein BGZ97_006958 [Linnemannia gamsii]|uniref:Uncharacterized protein n=1 Tax=Linnemannia gamsii TaxID=64522 RepID=A0A9P6RF18_9FUNG|nr:hypothetical protein BGZ97_006958 [Linnemannia gamsii]